MNKKLLLSIAFGMAIKRVQTVLGRTPTEVATLIGIKPAYFRLVLAGTNHLHISKALNLVDALDGEFELDGVIKILSCIATMDAYGRKAMSQKEPYAVGVKVVVEKFRAYDPQRFGYLFHQWNEDLFKAMKKPSFDPHQWIKSNGFGDLISDFLHHYHTFGKGAEELEALHALSFMKELPSIHFGLLDNLKNDLAGLPVKISFDTMVDWEIRNANAIKYNRSIDTRHDTIVNPNNLEHFRFPYLWEENFIEFQFFYMDTIKAEVVKNKFVKILRKKLEKSKDHKRLSSFDKAMKKVVFRYLPPEVFDKNQHGWFRRLPFKNPNSLWAFTVQRSPAEQKKHIGFVAKIEIEKPETSVGENMSYTSTMTYVETFKKLWNIQP